MSYVLLGFLIIMNFVFNNGSETTKCLWNIKTADEFKNILKESRKKAVSIRFKAYSWHNVTKGSGKNRRTVRVTTVSSN